MKIENIETGQTVWYPIQRLVDGEPKSDWLEAVVASHIDEDPVATIRFTDNDKLQAVKIHTLLAEKPFVGEVE